MPKIVFFDLDRTTWDDKMEVPESTIKAIEKLHQNGHLAFICTGRARANIDDDRIKEIGFDGVVAACGNHIEMNGKVLYENTLSSELIAKALALFDKYNMPAIIEGPEFHWFDTQKFVQREFVQLLWDSMGSKAKPLSEFKANEKVSKFTADIIKKTDADAVMDALKDEMDFIIHYGKAIEFIPKGTSKATGIRDTCRLLNIPHENTYAIGDGPNDLTMLEYVEHGIAMGNGTCEAKEVSEYVTDDIHENGIYNALKHYKLIA
ncbi:Cof-type HAD-IIB family hydrolase (plasmid) [Lachnospiraceae bacterium C1.1]|nr:Cof-type HAD-IIB family hydrolase [Lachnospiraceae bacterium C1.1]